MASVNYRKCKTRSEAKALIRHHDKFERMTHEHSNKEIDITKTPYNAQMDGDYMETCELLDDIIDKLDATTNTNRRKDRIEVFMLETAVPKGLSDKQKLDWVRRFREVVASMYGEGYILNVYYHVDEEHEYIDENDKTVMSREHAHLAIIPVDAKGSLNGKWFSAARNMRKLNDTLQVMTQKEFGVDYMDGSKRKSKKTVEQLKNESAVRKAVKSAVEELMPGIRAEAQQNAENAVKRQIDALQRQCETVEEVLHEADQLLDDLRNVAHERVVGKQVGTTKGGEPVHLAGVTVGEKRQQMALRRKQIQKDALSMRYDSPDFDKDFSK